MTKNPLRLGVSPLTGTVYAGRIKKNGYEWQEGKCNVTEDFRRCVVQACSESKEFVVDGMTFRVTCERIE